MTGGCEPVQAMRPLTRRAMGVLTPVVEITALAMVHSREHRACGGTGAVELIRDENAGHIPHALEPRAEERLRSLLAAPALPQDLTDVVVLIHRPPQVLTRAVDGQQPLIHMPRVTGLRPTAPEPIGVVRPDRQTLLATDLIRDVNTAFEQELLHVAVAQVKALIEPEPVADQFAGNAVMLVALRIGGRTHARRFPCRCCVMDYGGQQRGDYVMGSGGRSTS